MTNAATRFQPDISGSAVPSGFVGELKTFSSTGQAFPSSGADTNGITFQLPVGVWDIFGQVVVQAGSSLSVATPNLCFVCINSSSAALTNPLASGPLASGAVSGGALFLSSPLSQFVVTNAAANYYLVARLNYASQSGGTVDYRVYARRVA